MQSIDLLKGEKVESSLSPHPLSFMRLQAVCIFLIVWGIVVGWLVNYSDYKSLLTGSPWYPVIIWGIVLLLVGVVIALISIRWSIFFLYLAVFISAVAIILWQNILSSSALFIPLYSTAASIVGFLCVEVYRRSHRYVITNQRIIFTGGVLTKRTRTVRYDKISDINSQQGILGQIFGFGTIIPVSQAGLGLGSDKTFAAGGAAAGGSRLKFLGIAGGGKDVNTPRTRSFYELHGVYPFKEVLKLVENEVQGTVITPYQKEQVEFQRQQVDIQRQMRDLLKKQTHGHVKKAEEPEDEEEPEEEPEPQTVKTHRLKPKLVQHEEEPEGEAFGKGQVDIQQQMKELLKKQRTIKAAAVDDEDQPEDEDKDEADGEAKTGVSG